MPNISPLYSLPFSTIVMPYIRVEINGVTAVALIDTGYSELQIYNTMHYLIILKLKFTGAADISLMSSWIAKKAGIEHGINTRFQPECVGVGGLTKMRGHIKCKIETCDL